MAKEASINELREYFSYDPRSGEVTWIKTASVRSVAGTVCRSLDKDGYIRIRLRGRAYMAHRLGWALLYGYFPKELDHINDDRSDNRLKNLRLCNRSQNLGNMRPGKVPRSGYRGVQSRNFRWIAYCGRSPGNYIGSFATAEEAAKAYDDEATRRWGEFARLNFS